MKYGNITLGQIEAGINKIGGEEAFLRLLRGELVVSELQVANAGLVEHTIDFDKAPSIPSGWSVLPEEEQLRNRVRGQMKFDSTKVAFHLDDGQKGGKCIEGNKLRKKLADVPVYGAQLGDFYLANTHLIPEEWKGKAIFFWGTIYRYSDGFLCVRYLYWSDGRWYGDCSWLGGGWSSRNPAAVSAS